MVHVYKTYGQNYAIDTASGAVHKLSEIQADMMRYVTFPLSDSFPVTLRYDLAKYEAESIKKDYFELKKLCGDGVYMSAEPCVMYIGIDEHVMPDTEIVFSSKKPVFASDVIRAAENAPFITAREDINDPVNEKDYDILENEYERVAKEIIKRRMGKIPLRPFDFEPFELPFAKDEKGYTHLLCDDIASTFEKSGSVIRKKIIECAVAVHFSKMEG